MNVKDTLSAIRAEAANDKQNCLIIVYDQCGQMLYIDHLWKLEQEYGDLEVIERIDSPGCSFKNVRLVVRQIPYTLTQEYMVGTRRGGIQYGKFKGNSEFKRNSTEDR